MPCLAQNLMGKFARMVPGEGPEAQGCLRRAGRLGVPGRQGRHVVMKSVLNLVLNFGALSALALALAGFICSTA